MFMKKFKILLYLIGTAIYFNTYPQKLHSISGGVISNSQGNSISYSIGEPQVSILLNSNKSITQGFQQPMVNKGTKLHNESCDEGTDGLTTYLLINVLELEAHLVG